MGVYKEEFERLSQLIDALPENYLIGCFIVGLKDEVCLDVKLNNPRNLPEAIGVARLIEEQNTTKENMFPFTATQQPNPYYHCRSRWTTTQPKIEPSPNHIL